MTKIAKIPTLKDLVENKDEKQTGLTVLLNQNPPKAWLKKHPFISVKNNEGKTVSYQYIPRERLEYMLTRIYGKWWVEVKSVELIANSIVTVVRVYVTCPLTGETQWNDGVGGSPLQVDKGSGAIEFNNMKSTAVQMSAPASETYAFKDAVEKFGKLFGKDLNVNDIDYSGLLNEAGGKEVFSPKHKEWSNGVEAIRSGLVTVEQLEAKYVISEEDILKLKSNEI